MSSRIGFAVAIALLFLGVGAPANAQAVRYSGSLSYSTGSYVFAERTHSLWLSNGVAVTGSRVSASASLPLIVQNSGVVSMVGGQPVPTGGAGHAAVGRRSGDGTIGTRRRGSGDPGSTPMDSAVVEFRNTYALEVGDPSLRLAYDAISGLGFVRSLSLNLGAKAPLRGLESGVGTGAWDMGAGASLAVGVGTTWLFLDGAYWWFGDMPELELRDGALYSVGASRLLGTGGTSILLSVSGSSRIVPTAAAPLSASIGISRFLERGRSLSAGLGLGLSESSPDLSAYFGWSLPVGGIMSMDRAGCTISLAILTAALVSPPVAAQAPEAEWPRTDYASMDGQELYMAACAGCHAADGAGLPSTAVGFALPLPDFTDCSFATREPDSDWLAVSHDGGPVRGFDPLMPAFGGVLDLEQLQRAMDYVRSLCGDDAWPRGELNLPRAMATEKAYPEDEAVFTWGSTLDGPNELTGELVYEKRFGARNQIEVKVPFSYRERVDAQSWNGGLGDIGVGVKRAFYHSAERGSILSGAAELKLPTGDRARGFGAGTPVFETFVSYGHILPSDAFLQLQGVYERPFDLDRAGDEAALRLVLGRSFTEGAWGRTWSPMVEVLASRDLEDGATTHWDLLPQFQVTLNTRQHVMANLGVRFPVNDRDGREPRLLFYVLWDWFDGGFFEGW